MEHTVVEFKKRQFTRACQKPSSYPQERRPNFLTLSLRIIKHFIEVNIVTY